MFLHRTTTRILKKATAVALTAVTAFSALTLFPAEPVQKADAGDMLASGIYYIKNKKSGLYMDAENNSNKTGTNIIQYGYHSAMNQRYKVTKIGTYYYIYPMNVSGQTHVLEFANATQAKTSGSLIRTYPKCTSCKEQLFTIKRVAGTTDEYEIGSCLTEGKKVLRPRGGSTARWTKIELAEPSATSDIDNWIFEKASYMMSYNLLDKDASSTDQLDAEGIRSIFVQNGFFGDYQFIPEKNQIKNAASNSSVVVIHGHGNAGFVRRTDKVLIDKYKREKEAYEEEVKTNPSAVKPQLDPWCYAITADKIDEIFPGDTAKQMNLVYYASCHGADVSESYGTKSLLTATREKGARCVIAYQDGVAGAEDFLLYMMQYVRDHKYATIQQAINYADTKFSKKDKSSPSYPGNRYVSGNTGIILDLRLP